MLITQKWVTKLLNQANPGWSVSSAELDKGYVRVGFETEGYTSIPETTGPLVLGRVEQIEELTGFKKPIRFCQVNVADANGTGDLQPIVCGARNFQEGDLVVVALPGTVLPGNFEISARKTYDHISAGMICSAAELGLADKQNSGIIVLDDSYGVPGDSAYEILGLDDTIFDVNITPDRGYALSARGLTRELASAFNLAYTDPAYDSATAGIDLSVVPAVQGELLAISVSEATKARRFGLRKVSGIDPNAQSPFWLQRELMLSGQRPINAATDVTNYIMLLLGQPIHAFDADKIVGGLEIRTAREGEKFETLDHVERTLNSEDVVICDERGIQSLAGVMGGLLSEISENTTNVYFEAATWDQITTARTSRRHKLSSEASRRFERGVDSALVEIALDYACALLVDIAGGTVDSARSIYGTAESRPSISMEITRPGTVAGVDYRPETVIQRLEEIACDVRRDAQNGELLEVTPPTWRLDLNEKADLVEEVLRLEGLEDIPSLMPQAPVGRGLSPAQKRKRAIGHSLAYNGYVEVIPTPFIRNDIFDIWELAADDPRRKVVKVQNPLDTDYSVLGTTLLPSLCETIGRNIARGHSDVSIFGMQQVAFAHKESSPMPSVQHRPSEAELAQVLESLPIQPLHVATIATGKIDAEGVWGAGRDYTYADAIESARIVARAAGVELEVANTDENGYLPWHPGRCAQLLVAGEVVGYAGELHPQVLDRLGLPARVCAMEMNVSAMPLSEPMPAPVLSAFPTLNQDLALVVDEEVPAEQVRRTIREAAGDLLEKVELFDVYRSERLGAEKKSLAFSLTFRAPDRTLTDDECSERRMAAVELAAQRFGAEMRA
ncbi:phenylalanine--tRNA ligase subunit beta [Corynebacterium sp. sy017]|uniref:phenylalanine--tRNA ligase subunit beta n=1 Tax=unclassified Corynebacterium TaxID=2624378 RepID=UPI0011846AC0|nr:phenylalanine--tRNA ligase subunit beta [Corynebacterium sp. SY003]MBP3089183.1 phenylalanine--tRNA ligase subunit beta [Corynebacterium sp. sy017]TSD91493.1 phenylalanine--tRNA ligase subunit beta [Corynebacterium sp. SY003]